MFVFAMILDLFYHGLTIELGFGVDDQREQALWIRFQHLLVWCPNLELERLAVPLSELGLLLVLAVPLVEPDFLVLAVPLVETDLLVLAVPLLEPGFLVLAVLLVEPDLLVLAVPLLEPGLLVLAVPLLEPDLPVLAVPLLEPGLLTFSSGCFRCEEEFVPCIC